MEVLRDAFCFEDAHDLDFFLAQNPNLEKIDLVPLNYKGYQYAIHRGYSVLSFYDLLDHREYLDAKNESEKKITEFQNFLNEFSMSRDKEIRLGDYFLFNIQIVLGMIHLRSYFLTKIFDGKKYSSIIFLKRTGKEKIIYNFRPGFENQYLHLAETFLTKDKISTILGPPIESGTESLISRGIRKILYEGPMWIYSWWIHRREKIQKGDSKNIIGLLSASYDWRALLGDISKRARLKFYHQEFIPAYDTPIFTQLNLRLNSNPGSLAWLGKDLRPLLHPQIRMIASTLDYILEHKFEYKEEIRPLKMLLTTVTGAPLQGFFAHMAKILGKRVVYFQHGEKTLLEEPDPTNLSTEALFGTTYLCWGKNVAKEYLKLGFKEVIPVGSPRIFNILKNSTAIAGGAKILYASGKFLSDAHYFLYLFGADQRLAVSQKRLKEYFATLKNETILFRKNTTLHFDSTAVDFFSLPNVQECPESFTAALDRAKLIILDAPATTCVEACATEKPLFILMNRAIWAPDALASLKKRAIVEPDIESLIEKLNRYLLEGRYEADVKNKEFLLSYGLPNLEVDPAKAVLAYIDKCLDKEGGKIE